MKEAIQQKKAAYKKMCKNRSEENKAEYKNIKNQTKKVVANSMRKGTEKEITKLNKNPNNIFALVKFMKMGKIFKEVDAFSEKVGEKNMEKSQGGDYE